MSQSDQYLLYIIQKYNPHDLAQFPYTISDLQSKLKTWAGTCYIDIINSGSRVKGTAISLASDVDYLVSLKSNCNANSGGLKSIFESLLATLTNSYTIVRKQNVSVRIKINGLEIDITPARKQSGNTNDHSLYVSKLDTWRQTNIQKHINDISQSGRLNEIKVLKIWRELNKLDFPSIYLEYLVISNILLGKSKGNDYLASNVWHALSELAKNIGNPLFSRVVDPANSTNVLSDLLTVAEKNKIINTAKIALTKQTWGEVIW